MDRPTLVPLKIGDWKLDPVLAQLSRNGKSVRVDARALRLLLYLANRPGEVVSINQLLDEVWAGVAVTQDSVYQAVTLLRRLLGDDAKEPAYIATVPRMGYRLVAPVTLCVETLPMADPVPAPAAIEAPASAAGHSPQVPPPARRLHPTILFACAITLALLAFALVLYLPHPPAQSAASSPQRQSIGVLPFLDLTTQEMNEEYFADGMTEELIDKLSKIGGFKVPAATASFYYKGRQVPLATIGTSLGVAYLLDGSIRKSGPMLRIAVRLMRARDGYVIWSQTYDRPVADRLQVQDEIAAAVAQYLSTALS